MVYTSIELILLRRTTKYSKIFGEQIYFTGHHFFSNFLRKLKYSDVLKTMVQKKKMRKSLVFELSLFENQDN